MKTYPSYIRETRAPSVRAPPRSCDCQVHVYGDPTLYPPRPGTPYEPPDATHDALRRMHATLGIERGIIVQAACYGTDHRVAAEALDRLGAGYKGCAIVNDALSDEDLQRLNALGFSGARFNFAKVLRISIEPGEFRNSLARIRTLGWYAKIFTLGDELLQNEQLFAEIDMPVVLDHMGGLDFRLGIDQKAVGFIRDLLAKGNWWLMLSSGDRHSLLGHPWDDAVPYARRFIEAAPERMIWATDWPHVIYEGEMPNDGDLLDLLYRYAPDAGLQKKILVDNPAKLFGFPPLAD